MKPKNTLLIGSVIALILAILWYFDVVSEPIVGIASAILVFLGFLFTDRNQSEDKAYTNKISQKHSGTGDNIAGNKIDYRK